MFKINNKKPNHICKYSQCTLGVSGGKKHYYACDDCDRLYSWRSVACCPEHFTAYQDEVLASRRKPLTFEEKKEVWKPIKVDDTDIDEIVTGDIAEKKESAKRNRKI